MSLYNVNRLWTAFQSVWFCISCIACQLTRLVYCSKNVLVSLVATLTRAYTIYGWPRLDCISVFEAFLVTLAKLKYPHYRPPAIDRSPPAHRPEGPRGVTSGCVY